MQLVCKMFSCLFLSYKFFFMSLGTKTAKHVPVPITLTEIFTDSAPRPGQS